MSTWPKVGMGRFLESPPHAKPLPPRPPPAALARPAQEAAEAGWRGLRGSPPGLSMTPPFRHSPLCSSEWRWDKTVR